MKKIILSLVCVGLLCGCSGYKEINNGFLVTSVAVGKTDNDIEIMLNVIQPENEKGLILSGSGTDLKSAYKEIKKSQTKTLYFEHCGTIVLNQNIKGETKQILNFCKSQMNIPIAAQVVYCSDAKALFNADQTGYDVISLIKNTGGNGQNRIYKIEQGKNTKIPTVAVKDNTMVFEGEK
ncbi:MAG: hypothetical protein Q4B40_00495 [Clostridia bacterium]|nr:hypothetical protein [Clostridia bacterium]